MVCGATYNSCYPFAQRARVACPLNILPTSQAVPLIHVYQPSDEGAAEEVASASGDAPGEEVMAAAVYELPSRTFEGLW